VTTAEPDGGTLSRAEPRGTDRRRGVQGRLVGEKDLYFPPEDEHYASQYIPNGEVRVIPGVWGHFAGSGDSPVDLEYIDGVLKELLATAAGP
jgi:hypothetical protein